MNLTDMLTEEIEKLKERNVNAYKEDSCWNEAETFEFAVNLMKGMLMPVIEKLIEQREVYAERAGDQENYDSDNAELAAILGES